MSGFDWKDRRVRWAAAIALAVTTMVVALEWGRRHAIRFGYFTHAPIYGKWAPITLDNKYGLAALATGILLAVTGFLILMWSRIPIWAAHLSLIVTGTMAAAAVNLLRGNVQHLTRGISTEPASPYYTVDLHHVYQFGIRGFVENYPLLTEGFKSWNSRTHPPGVHLLLYGLFQLFGSDNRMAIATAIAAMGMAACVPAWYIGKLLGGDQAGWIAALLTVSAPGTLLFAYTAMDAVFATLLATAIALFLAAIHAKSLKLSAAAGAVLGLTTFLTYATAFIALTAFIAVLVQARNVKLATRLLLAATLGGLAVIAALHVAFGFDLLAAYGKVPSASFRYDPYWIVGAPAAVLIFAGLPSATVGVAGLTGQAQAQRRPVLLMALFAFMLIWFTLPSEITNLRPGEVERTWAFMYPVLAGCAAPLLDRSLSGGKWSNAVLAGLALVSVGQAIYIQSRWETIF